MATSASQPRLLKCEAEDHAGTSTPNTFLAFKLTRTVRTWEQTACFEVALGCLLGESRDARRGFVKSVREARGEVIAGSGSCGVFNGHCIGSNSSTPLLTEDFQSCFYARRNAGSLHGCAGGSMKCSRARRRVRGASALRLHDERGVNLDRRVKSCWTGGPGHLLLIRADNWTSAPPVGSFEDRDGMRADQNLTTGSGFACKVAFDQKVRDLIRKSSLAPEFNAKRQCRFR